MKKSNLSLIITSIWLIVYNYEFSCIVNILIRTFVFSYTVSYTTYFLGTAAIVIGVAIGILMPIISNLLTVQKALGKKIRDSLDVFHVGANEVYAKIIKLEDFGLSPFEFVLGLTLTTIGVITYYFVPAAFLFQKFELFFFFYKFAFNIDGGWSLIFEFLTSSISSKFFSISHMMDSEIRFKT